MKVDKRLSILLFFFVINFSIIFNLSTKDDSISDAELDEMLKDPKYASLLDGKADDLLKASPLKKKKDVNNTSVKNTKKPIDLIDLDIKDDEDLLKKTSNTEKFRSYDFISKQQARYLIEILKQPVFFNMLPQEAKNIVKVTKDNFEFKMAQDGKLDEYLETNLVNTPSCTSFIDSNGSIGRKGVLTIVDPNNSTSKFVWTVLNSKTLTFYENQSYMSIIKLIRLSQLTVKDISATPCFLVANIKAANEGSLLVCSNNTQEKEVWITSIKSLNKRNIK